MYKNTVSTDVKTSETSKRWRPYQIYLILLLTAISTSNYMDRQIVPILQEFIKVDLKLTDTQLGFLTGPAFALFYSASGIPIARLAERLNRAKMMSWVVVMWSSMTAMCGLAPNFMILAACRLGVGLGEGGCIPISHSLISDYFRPNQRGLAMAIYSTSAPLAGILVPVVGAWVAHIWGWRAAFFAVGIPGLLLALLVWRTMREPRFQADKDGIVAQSEPPGSFSSDLKWLFTNQTFIYMFLAAAFTGIATYGMTVFLVSFLVRVHGFDIVQGGSVFAMNGVMGLIGTFIGGYFADRYAGTTGRSYPAVCGIGMAFAFVFYMSSVLVSSWQLALVGIFIANIGTDLKNGPAFATVQNIVPIRMRATAAAMFMFGATLIGAGVGPFLVGFLSDTFAQQYFLPGLNFAATCPGGHAVSGAPAQIVEACKTASGMGLRKAMAMNCLMYIGGTIAYGFAAWSMKKPIG